MANYSLVVDSKFSPFTFQELLQPALMATQAHQELEKEYSNLATKANIWDGMVDEQRDHETYKKYKAFAKDLEEQASKLAREGLNAANRRGLLNMSTRYNKEIVPIENAYKRKQELVDEQRKALLQDPTALFEKDASLLSLDDFVANPQMSYTPYSGKALTNQVGAAVKNFIKQMQDNPRKWRSILKDQYYETIMQKGLSPNDILKVLNEEEGASPVLQKIVNDVLESTGISKWKDRDMLNKAKYYAGLGLWEGIGDTKYETLANKGFAATGTSNPSSSSLALNPSNIYSSRKLSEEEENYKKNIKNFSKYFYEDNKGQTHLTEEGRKEYRRNAAPYSIGPTSMTFPLKNNRPFIASDFKNLLDSIGGSMSMDENASWDSTKIGKLWKDYINNNPAAKTAQYDATKLSEYIIDAPQDNAYQTNIKKKLSRAIGSNGEFIEVDLNSDNQWEPTGDTLPFSKFDTDDYHYIAQAPSTIGTTILIQKDGEKAKRYQYVPGINTTAELGRDEALTTMLQVQQMLSNPNLSDYDRLKLEKYYQELTQNVAKYSSQIDLTNKLDTQNVDIIRDLEIQ